jgi:hypothetical protein
MNAIKSTKKFWFWSLIQVGHLQSNSASAGLRYGGRARRLSRSAKHEMIKKLQ